MKLERVLFQKSYLYLIGFFIFMLLGFWVTYFTQILDQENYRMHLHGTVMILWCILLIAQAYLIRRKKIKLHRQLGKTSYLLVPLIAFTTVDLYKFRLNQSTTLENRDYLFTSSVLIALLVFLIYYLLAIYFKNKPAVHARFMICTIFAMFTAIIDRIIDSYFPSLLPFFPSVDGPVIQVVGLTLADILLVILCVWDWKSHKRLNVFPVALLIHLFYHYAVMNFYKFEFWKSFSIWFFKL